jgi:methyl-accepting chemotaxis protein
MVSNKEVAQEIVKLLQESEDITKKTQNRIIKEVSKRIDVGSVMVTDVLSQLKALQVVSFQIVQRAKVYSVNKKNLDRIGEIKD